MRRKSGGAGKPGNPSRGKQTFETYVLEKWLPHHLLEPGVRSHYAGHIRSHLLQPGPHDPDPPPSS